MDSTNVIRRVTHLPAFFLLALLLLGLSLLPQPTTAQSMWDNPFESPSSEQQDDEPRSLWDARTQDHDDSDPWNTDDPYNTSDPWGLDERDDARGNSDWARDFYDFEDENDGSDTDGSARRVGDGPTTMAKNECDVNGNGCPTGQVCCTVGNSENRKCRKSCNGKGNTPVVPLSGLVYLLLAGLGYGGYRLRKQQADA